MWTSSRSGRAARLSITSEERKASSRHTNFSIVRLARSLASSWPTTRYRKGHPNVKLSRCGARIEATRKKSLTATSSLIASHTVKTSRHLRLGLRNKPHHVSDCPGRLGLFVHERCVRFGVRKALVVKYGTRDKGGYGIGSWKLTSRCWTRRQIWKYRCKSFSWIAFATSTYDCERVER